MTNENNDVVSLAALAITLTVSIAFLIQQLTSVGVL
jgi:hypothetical protein